MLLAFITGEKHSKTVRFCAAAYGVIHVVTAMPDDSLLIITLEHKEWGNPNKEEYYNHILSYSPYGN